MLCGILTSYRPHKWWGGKDGARLYKPLECAIGLADDATYLLLDLGARFDFIIHHDRTRDDKPEGGRSLITWSDRRAQSLTPKQNSSPPLPEPDSDLWSDYNSWLKEGNLPDRIIHRAEDTTAQEELRTYYEAIVKAMRSRLPENHVDCVPRTPTSQLPNELPKEDVSGYVKMEDFLATSIGIHLKASYDRLYQACWSGNNKAIEEMCLPQHAVSGEEVLVISVKTTTFENGHLGRFVLWRPTRAMNLCEVGLTPMTLALARRHWDTAKLILAIAKAQYQPSPVRRRAFKVNELFIGKVTSTCISRVRD